MRSEALRRRLGLGVPALFDAGSRVAEHPRFEQIYPEYLFLLHSIIRAAVPLMSDAVRQLEAQDDAPSALIEYLRSHVLEEQGHDVWVLEDLETLGVTRNEIRCRMPSPRVAELVGAQYYWIRHHDPVAILGYIAVLEGYPPTVQAVDDLVARTELPPAAFRTLRDHADVDHGHSAQLDQLIDSIALTGEQFTLVSVSGLMTVAGLVRCLDELVEEHEAGAPAGTGAP